MIAMEQVRQMPLHEKIAMQVFFGVALLLELWCWHGVEARGDSLDVWFPRNPVPTGGRLWATAYGRGLNFLLPTGGGVLVSRDAKVWIDPSSGMLHAMSAMAWGDPGFVGVAWDGSIL